MPLLWISLCFGIGLLVGQSGWAGSGWAALAAVALLLWSVLTLLRRKALPGLLRWWSAAEPHLLVPPLVLVGFLFLGAWRMAASGPDITSGHIAGVNDQGRYRIRAVVVAPPDIRDRSTRLRLSVESAAQLDKDGNPGEERPAHGLMLAVLPGNPGYAYGDRLELEGSPVTPPDNEEFSYQAYLARQNVYTYITYPQSRLVETGAGSPLFATIYRIRDWAFAEVTHLFPAPEGPLLAGILLGIETEMPDALTRAFRDTGTAHVIAISGFNIAILIQLFSSLFGRFFPRWGAALAAVIAVAGYTVLVGAAPSVVRAAIMGSMALAASLLGRRSTAVNSLAFTGMLMSLGNPHLPWDPSFQLSFFATLGLILYGERFEGGFRRLFERRISARAAQKIAAPVGEYLLMTLAAQLMTLPVVLYHFQRISISALLANPLILPVQPLVMVLSGAAVITGAVSDPLAHALAWLAWPLSAYTNRMVELLAGIPSGVVVTGEVGLGTTVLMYAGLIAPLLNSRLPAQIKSAVNPALGCITAALLAGILWRAAAASPDGRLHLVVMDMDGSQAVLVQSPTGETVLVNGGPSARALKDALGRRISPFVRRLDAVAVNDSAAGAMNAILGILDTYPPRQVLWGASPAGARSSQELSEALQNRLVPTHRLIEGDVLNIGEVRLSVRAASEEGSALLLEWGRFRVLAPGGTALDLLPPGDLCGLSLLLLENRDMQNEEAAGWQVCSPQALIVTASGERIAGGKNILLTRPEGWVVITTDGERMWIEQHRTIVNEQ